MNDPAIRLRFPNARAAAKAFDTLQELEYRTELIAGCEPPELAVHIERHDVQSALEIAYAFEGKLVEHGEDRPKRSEFDPDEVVIPAHAVTEDFSDRYMTGESDDFLGDEADAVREGYRESIY
ncbi:DNA/RNA helicase [Paenibacillus sp.]|uniref:DNA/RNA helicase n=1 Tax=Paenibacillus sp. TaxID=58172 RepID=UPI002D354854|nr:DNA/RNA helicase [Paenibacillus sp.]HZG55129.1 DNA/RNA helicase [Paenibacillus sp.]